MDGTAGGPDAGVEHLFVGVHPREEGEEGGVDVERGRGLREERLGEDAHVAVEADEVRVVPRERVEDAFFVGRTGLVLTSFDDFRGDFALLGGVEDRRVGVVRQHDGELGVAG